MPQGLQVAGMSVETFALLELVLILAALALSGVVGPRLLSADGSQWGAPRRRDRGAAGDLIHERLLLAGVLLVPAAAVASALWSPIAGLGGLT
jgi:hypothetical protein